MSAGLKGQGAIKDAEEASELRKASRTAMQEADAAEQAALASAEEAESADEKAAVSQETAKKLADAAAPDAEAAASTSARWRAQVFVLAPALK